MALAGQVEVARIVDLAAHRLGIAIDYDAAALRATPPVTLRETGRLTDADLWALANRVLAGRGLCTVRVQGGYSIVKIAEAPGLARVESADEPGPMPGFRTVMITATHQPARSLSESIGKVLSKGGGGAVAIGDRLLVSDLAPQVDRALALTAALDVPGPPVVPIEVRLTSASTASAPSAMVTLINQITAKVESVGGRRIPGEVIPGTDQSILILAPQEHAGYWTDLIARLDRREEVSTRVYRPQVFGVKEVGRLIEQAVTPQAENRWKLITDELTESLLVTATAAQHELVRAILERVDSVAVERRPVRSFTIRNRPVRDIQATLEQLVLSGVLAGDHSASPGGAAPGETGAALWPPAGANVAPGAVPSASRTFPQAATGGAAPSVVSTSPASPSVTTFGQHYDHRPPPAPDLVLSTDEGTNTLIAMGEPRLLAQIESLLQSLDVRQAQVMLEVLIVSLSDSQTLDLGVELEATGMTDDVRSRIASLFGLGSRDSAGNRIGGDGLGLTGVILNPGDFSIIIRALQTLNKGRSLSMPRLLVTNNQQATLDSVLEQPFASTNASNTVTTTSFGGSKPAGTQITLKPQIAEGDHLLLDYNISLSAFVGAAASAAVPPPRQENKVQSAAMLPDGHTVVVGGIELNTEGKATTQVPGLGQIPIIGELFKNRSNTNSRNRFYVFIRANILRHGSFEDLKYLSEVATGGAQVDDGWPVVEPRVIK
ncbi:MAG: hypothetical protein KF678_10985 [Phycisphaeraceae bacterium]|nr:hypothetical protein [Phycisphaeraceae bacterium]